MDNKSKKFLTLQAKWDAKLKRDGFDDIEQRDGSLKRWASHFFATRYNKILFKAKEDYYRAAGQFLHSHKFESENERYIWELHTEGVSIRDIVVIMKKRGVKTYKFAVNKLLKRLVELMVESCQE